MKWPERVQEILDALATQHPDWVADDTGPRYRLNEMVAQQARYELGPDWGLKRADPGRPISSENIAKREGSRLIAWAWENRHDGTWEHMPEGEDITGQTFVPVEPINHLGVAPEPQPEPGPTPGPVPQPPPIPNVPGLEQIAAECKRQADEIAAFRVELVAAIDKASAELAKAVKSFRLWATPPKKKARAR